MRSTERRLRHIFTEVLVAAGAVTACGGGTSEENPQPLPTTSSSSSSGGSSGTTGTVPPPAGYTSLCDPGQAVPPLPAGLRAAPALDGIATRAEYAFPMLKSSQGGDVDNPDSAADGWNGTSVPATGTLCATATNKQACLDKVNGLRVLPTTRDDCVAKYPSGAYSENVCGLSYFLYTRGDEIGVAITRDEIQALIGTFDTLSEAMWAAQGKGYSIACSDPSIPDSGFKTSSDGTWEFSLIETANCAKEQFKIVARVDYKGTVTEVSREKLATVPGCAVAGRRPEGLCRPTGAPMTTGDHLADMATLEAASVLAFRRLERQLRAVGAPVELLARAREAARDEVRHARVTAALARKHGATAARPEIAKSGAPSIFDIALENAREGQVRESYGALLAHVQAERAEDPDVRAAMRVIAEEETAHAALSWDVAAFLESRLDARERATLALARHEAFEGLAAELARPIDEAARSQLGLPAPAEALRLLHHLAPTLLAA